MKSPPEPALRTSRRRTGTLALPLAALILAASWFLLSRVGPWTGPGGAGGESPPTHGSAADPSSTASQWTPPTLEELRSIHWVRRPCVFFLDHLRHALEAEPPPATEAEALALSNVGEDSNAKILGALGRLPKSDDEVDWDATFNRFVGGEPRTLNPLFFTSRYESWLEDLLFVGPVQYDWKFDYYGDLNVVESWETSEDRLMDRIVFRNDLVWSDGTPFTAHDVEFTWKLLLDRKIRADSRRTLAEGLRAVKAYDDQTVVYFHKELLVTNNLSLSWGVLPRHAFEKVLAEDPTLETTSLNREPITCGPYRLVSWTRGRSLVLERREDWYRKPTGETIRARPFFRRVRFVLLPDPSTRFFAFKVGETDDTQLDSNQWVNETSDPDFVARNVKVRGDDEWTYAFIGWNQKSVPPNPFFSDRRVRLAMTLALDHDFLLKEAFFGIYRPGEGIFHPDSWMAAKELRPFHRDAARAERLLEEAGWKDSDGDGVRDKPIDGHIVPFRFTLSCPNAGTGPRVADQLQSDLRSIGVQCDVQLVEWVAFTQMLSDRKPQAYLMMMGTGVDPDTARNLWETDAYLNGRNDVGYSNPVVDELFERGRREFDPARRAAIYAEIDRRIYEDQPITILLYQPTLWGFSRSIRGYRPSPKGFYGYAPGFNSLWKKK